MMSGRAKIQGGLPMGFAYILVQLVASICAGLTYSTVHGGAFSLGPVAPFGWVAAATVEVVFTMVLCFVVLSVATVRVPSKDMFGLAIGSCFTVGGYAAGGVSGGALNPAIAFGVDATNAFYGGGLPWTWVAYTVFECIGALLAAGVFFLTRPIEFGKSSTPLLPSWAKAIGPRIARGPVRR